MPVIDVWSEAHVTHGVMDVLVAPQFSEHFLQTLYTKGVREIKLIKNDVQK